jgi:predicted nucleotidyltransferase
MADRAVLAAVENYLAEVRRAGIRASRAIVFGSHARNEATAESDIDVVVVAPEFDGNPGWATTVILWRLRARTDRRIEPIAVGEHQWADDDNPIIAAARRDGVTIMASSLN